MHRNSFDYDYEYDWTPKAETKSTAGSHHSSKKAKEEKKEPTGKVGQMQPQRSPSPEKPAVTKL